MGVCRKNLMRGKIFCRTFFG